jgi:hypothetical protein
MTLIPGGSGRVVVVVSGGKGVAVTPGETRVVVVMIS